MPNILVLNPKEKDLGGFSVRRLIPHPQVKMVGPWIFFDHMGPAFFPVGEGINVRPHPHINLATVTYLFEGEVLHRDSLGNKQLIKPGDINLMVSGKGITHSERMTEEQKHSSHEAHGLQLWHALPEKDEEIDPAFYHYGSKEMPIIKHSSVELRVMMGEAFGVKSPVKTFAETLYFEATIPDDSELELPKAEEIAVYVVSGEAEIIGQIVPRFSMAFLKDGGQKVKALKDSRIAVIGGEKFTDRHIEWNFVSSSKERIEKAKEDWENGKFSKVPGDEEEFIPLP